MINFPPNQIEAINNNLYPVHGKASDWQPLMEMVGDKEIVLIGEATHGTDEFYRARAEITKRLIQEKGFTVVAVEADWPDSYRVNRYLLGDKTISSPEETLSLFERFPTWMWRNKAVVDFLSWLHFYNEENENKIGFYGLDLYSMNASIREVLEYLKIVDKAALERVIKRYNCFASFNGDVKAYGFAASIGIIKSCEKEITE
jgi:erythromycin esterase-like protein